MFHFILVILGRVSGLFEADLKNLFTVLSLSSLPFIAHFVIPLLLFFLAIDLVLDECFSLYSCKPTSQNPYREELVTSKSLTSFDEVIKGIFRSHLIVPAFQFN